MNNYLKYVSTHVTNLHLSGSAFRVESAAEPARDSSEAAASALEAPDAA